MKGDTEDTCAGAATPTDGAVIDGGATDASAARSDDVMESKRPVPLPIRDKLHCSFYFYQTQSDISIDIVVPFM